jgi:hypothetical protein
MHNYLEDWKLGNHASEVSWDETTITSYETPSFSLIVMLAKLVIML